MFPFLILATALFSASVFALPSFDGNLEAANFIDGEKDALGRDYDFEGIIDLGLCSGALVRFEGAEDSQHALMLTNGHCHFVDTLSRMVPAKTYMDHLPTTRSFKILSKDGTSVLGRLRASQLIYATMTGTDVAFYELEKTYKEIEEEFDTKAIVIDSQRPTEKEAIEVVTGLFHGGYTCVIDRFVYQLKEADYLMNDSIRYSKECKTKGGTSGSPILSKSKRKVVGINNTGNEKGERCTMDNPCEISSTGEVTFEKGLNYGQQTHLVYTCLNNKHELDITVPGCQLYHETKYVPVKRLPLPKAAERKEKVPAVR